MNIQKNIVFDTAGDFAISQKNCTTSKKSVVQHKKNAPDILLYWPGFCKFVYVTWKL